jgi:hypothetical protein
MKQSASQEANSRSAAEGICSLLWNTVDRVHKGPAINYSEPVECNLLHHTPILMSFNVIISYTFVSSQVMRKQYLKIGLGRDSLTEVLLPFRFILLSYLTHCNLFTWNSIVK